MLYHYICFALNINQSISLRLNVKPIFLEVHKIHLFKFNEMFSRYTQPYVKLPF